MRDWGSDDAIDARPRGELMRTIKVFHFVQGHLTGSGGGGNRGVGQRAAVGQSKNARGKADLAHGDRNASWSLGREAQQMRAVGNGASGRGDFNGIGLRTEKRAAQGVESRSAPEIMGREKNAGDAGARKVAR